MCTYEYTLISIDYNCNKVFHSINKVEHRANSYHEYKWIELTKLTILKTMTLSMDPYTTYMMLLQSHSNFSSIKHILMSMTITNNSIQSCSCTPQPSQQSKLTL